MPSHCRVGDAVVAVFDVAGVPRQELGIAGEGDAEVVPAVSARQRPPLGVLLPGLSETFVVWESRASLMVNDTSREAQPDGVGKASWSSTRARQQFSGHRRKLNPAGPTSKPLRS